MKTYTLCLLTLTLFISSTGLAQNKCVLTLGDNLCLVKEEGQYGVTRKGKYIIPSYFDTVIAVKGDYFIVRQRQNWGLFNGKGTVLVPVSYYSVTPIDVARGLFEIAGHGTRNIALIDNAFKVEKQTRMNEKWSVSTTEVTLHEYLCFVNYIVKNKPKEISLDMVMPDTLCMDKRQLPALRAVLHSENALCKKELPYFAAYGLGITVDCEFALTTELTESLKYPATCISYDQAQLYCHWLADRLTEKLIKSDEHYYFVIRLPHPYEWEEMANKGLGRNPEHKLMPDSIATTTQCVNFNYKNSPVCGNAEVQHLSAGLNPAHSFTPDVNGNYGVFGNAAEMTSEKKLCKGGSYMHYARECKYERMIPYKKTEPWLGFRYVVEVRRKE